MDFNSISWISQSDLCRCCLSSNATLYLTETNNFSSNVSPEAYINILHDSLGITLSHMKSSDTSQYICKACANHLSEIYSFQKQVIKAENLYKKYWDHIIDEKYKKENIKDNRHKNYVIITEDHNYDSDTPIAVLKHKHESAPKLNDYCKKKYSNKFDNSVENNDDNSFYNKNGIGVSKLNFQKQISERKQIILTCNNVLKETTACPFRHHKSWFQCFFCSKDFMEINALKEHNLQSHINIEEEIKKIKRYPHSLQIDISNLKCRNCHLSLKDIDTMKNHLLEEHDKVIYKECIADYKVNSSPYSCHLCKLEFHVFRTLTTHLNEHYANCICDVCGKSFINSKRLKVHKHIHEKGIFPCAECGKVLKTKISKANHMESAHSKRVVKCQICFKPMKHYNDRIKHMSEEHNITHSFKCPICNREYNIKHYLATHIRQTHGNKNKKCNECEMAFITNHGLKKHMLKHTRDKPYFCNICNKMYARSYSLKEHMKIHDSHRRLVTPP